MMTTTADWINPDAKIWRNLRIQVRIRIAKAMQHLLTTGRLNRADICRIGEVSVQQAAADIKIILERTDALTYDRSGKFYLLKGKAK